MPPRWRRTRYCSLITCVLLLAVAVLVVVSLLSVSLGITPLFAPASTQVPGAGPQPGEEVTPWLLEDGVRITKAQLHKNRRPASEGVTLGDLTRDAGRTWQVPSSTQAASGPSTSTLRSDKERRGRLLQAGAGTATQSSNESPTRIGDKAAAGVALPAQSSHQTFATNATWASNGTLPPAYAPGDAHPYVARCVLSQSPLKLRILGTRDDPSMASRRSSLCTPPEAMSVLAPPCRRTVALASYEGSGNHFVRLLLEQSTRVLSGSKFNDMAHLRYVGAALPRGKSLQDYDALGATVVTKTHLLPRSGRSPLGRAPGRGRAIVIVRDPRYAMLANYNRIGWALKFAGRGGGCQMTGKHSVGGKLGKDQGHRQVVDDWELPSRRQHFARYALCEAKAWVNFLSGWLGSYSTKLWRPMLVIRYEDIMSDTEGSLVKLLEFIGFPPTAVPASRWACVVEKKGMGKRVRDYDPWVDKSGNQTELSRKVLQATKKFAARFGYAS
eukprot:jgi/Mesvir1/18723/Mv01236-RA.1